MAKVALTEQYLEDIADAIRAKNETSNTYTPPEMAPAILALPAGGGIIPTGTISITTNGTHNVYNYASANVQVSSTINNQNKTVSPSTSQQSITADSGYTGLGTVTIEAMPSGTAGTPTATKGTVSNHSISVTPSVTNTTGYITGGTKTGTSVTISASELASGNKAITANGTGIDVIGYSTVSVNVSGGGGTINNQDKTVTSSGTLQTVTYDNGYTGLGTVTINAAPEALINQQAVTGTPTITVDENGEIGAIYYSPDTSVSPVTTAGWVNTSTEVPLYVTISGTSQLSTQPAATITPTTSSQVAVAAGKYTTGAVTVAAMPTITLPTAVSSTSSGTSKATLSLTGGTKYLNIPTGYNETAQYYTLSVANGSATGPSSLSGTSATVSTGTNTLTLTKTGVTTTPTVSAGYVSSATASTATVALTASITTKAAATITPGTTNQTIASGTYLTGTQTIAGDADLVGGNILSTANIFGVQGTVVVQNYYTGSSAPSSSTGSNGDLYLQS